MKSNIFQQIRLAYILSFWRSCMHLNFIKISRRQPFLPKLQKSVHIHPIFPIIKLNRCLQTRANIDLPCVKATDALPFWTCTQSLFMERKWKIINSNDGHCVRAGDKMSLSLKLRLYLFMSQPSLMLRISDAISKCISAKCPTSPFVF